MVSLLCCVKFMPEFTGSTWKALAPFQLIQVVVSVYIHNIYIFNLIYLFKQTRFITQNWFSCKREKREIFNI